VVLGGGGARGLAHLGLLQQLQAAGVPIDVIGGASQGSYVAAAWALTGRADAARGIVAALASSVASTWNFMTSLTLPLVSWTSGAHFDDVIREALGDAQIEDLPGARFFCVSLNATDGAVAVHR
jgi:lysophospholipid hydrolase